MTWWRRLFRNRTMEAQLDRELQFHLDQHTADLVAHGVAPEQARRQARIELGGPEQVKEGCRDARGTRWLLDLLQDTRYALRTLRARPGFAAVALLTLALGTGATTVIFTVIRGVMLKPLPFAHPERLVSLQEQTDYSTAFGNLWAFTNPNFLDCKRAVRSVEMEAWRFRGGTLTVAGDSEYVEGFEVSAGLFPMLGVAPARGRVFRAEEERVGAPPVAMIGYALWQHRFNGSPQVLGASIDFDGQPYTIVGVAPPEFRLNSVDAGVYALLGQNPSPGMQNRAAHRLVVWGRLLPGATIAAAQSELAAVGRELAREYPKSNKGRTFIAAPLTPEIGDVRSTLWLLFGAVGIVLLIACANIASLLLARAVARERELAMRAALGAGRGRLVRQCLTESAVLALAGGLLGMGLAAAAIRPFIVYWPGSLPRAEEVGLDWQVLLFAFGVSLVCGLLFGVAPALRIPTRALERVLRAGSRTVSAGSRVLQGAFVAGEIALAVVLLVSAGMLGRTVFHLMSLDSGVKATSVLTARVALAPSTLANPARTRAAWQDLMDRARRVPGVLAIATVDTVPMRSGNNPVPYAITAAPAPENQQPLTLANSVSPDYLNVMGIALRRGRFFDDQDRLENEHVAVIDEVMAREAFGDQDPIGRHLWIGLGTDPLRVVGVVAHVRYWGPAADDRARIRAQTYYPLAQVPDNLMRRWSELMSIAVRTAVPPSNLLEPLRKEIAGGGGQVIYEARTIEQLAAASLARQRFLLLLFGVFAGLALLLACIGVYGVLAYLTGSRVPEIGLRMALGASAGEVLWLVLRQSLGLIALGIAGGVIAAIGAARVLQRSVEGMGPVEPVTYAAMIVILLAAALVASFVPARRASRVDPMLALRQE